MVELFRRQLPVPFRVIGQNAWIKSLKTAETTMVSAVISFFGEDIGWTKRVDKNGEKHCNHREKWAYIFLENTIERGKVYETRNLPGMWLPMR